MPEPSTEPTFVGAGISDAQAVEIAERAGGNPFFIIETTGMLMTDGARSGSGAHAAIPPTVQAVVSARLDALPARLRELARRASVFMYDFDREELAVVDENATMEELQDLEEAELVVRDKMAAGAPTWRMRHAALKDVPYAGRPQPEPPA